MWLRNQMQSTLRLHSRSTFHGKVPPQKRSQSFEKASEDCLLVCNMIAPESGAQLYEGSPFSVGMEPSSGLEAPMTANRNAKTSGPGHISPVFTHSGSRTNEASRTVRKVHPLANEASKKTCETAWSWNHSRKGTILWSCAPRFGKNWPVCQ